MTATPVQHEAASSHGRSTSTVIDRLLCHLENHMSHCGDSTAVITQTASATWAEIASDTARLTAALRRYEIGRGNTIALATGRTRYATSALLAVWACGATTVLLDERHPVERTALALRDAGARWVLADQVTSALLGLGVPVLPATALIADSAAADYTRIPCLAEPVQPDDRAYLIYTSGSTGAPKGVEVGFANLEAFLGAIETLNLPRGGVGINAVSPAFDGWLWCTLLYLVYGQSLSIVDLAVSDHSGIGAAIEAAHPRIVCLTPSLLAACECDLDSAEVVVAAGEVCPPVLVRRFASGRRMLNVYGPTETTIAATWADSAQGHDLTTIGVALPGYATQILDEQRQPVPTGEIGELFIGGPAVAHGYRNRPDLTEQRFVPDRFRPGGRTYATGDMVRERRDGMLEFLGRSDGQVKVRGFRVELEEIERQSQLIPGVGQAAAFKLPGGQVLCLAVVPSASMACPADAELRARLGTALPDYQLPSKIIRCAALPVSSSGKVDRTALANACGAEAMRELPRASRCADARESVIAGIWTELLGTAVEDADTSFFEAGGHSLLAARMISAVRSATGAQVSMRDLLANPTIRSLAQAVDRLLGDAHIQEGS
jgi:amino acid adenylation domain-containing protein